MKKLLRYWGIPVIAVLVGPFFFVTSRIPRGPQWESRYFWLARSEFGFSRQHVPQMPVLGQNQPRYGPFCPETLIQRFAVFGVETKRKAKLWIDPDGRKYWYGDDGRVYVDGR